MAKKRYKGSSEEFYQIEPRTSNQNKYCESLYENPITLCDAPAGCGKAQPNYSPVFTTEGYKRMDEIKVGDYAYGVDGKPIKITGVYPQKNLEIYEITFTDRTKVDCCIDHLWRVSIGNKANKNWQVLTLREILKLKLDKLEAIEIPVTNPLVFPEKDLPLDPYILGCILGDGHIDIAGAIEQTCSGQDYPTFSEYIGLYYEYNKSLENDNKVMKINNVNFRETIKNLNISGTLFDTKFIPEDYLYASINQRLAVVQGLMDTDGSTSIKGSQAHFSTKNITLNKQFAWLVRSLGGVAEVTLDKSGDTFVRFRLPLGMDYCRLERKIKNQPHSPPVKKIKNISYKGIKDGRCIKVDHPLQLYLTNALTVTHNTLFALRQGIKDQNKGKINKIYYVRNDSGMPTECAKPRGALPGGLIEKFGPLYGPVVDNLQKLVDPNKAQYMVDKGIIEALFLEDIRGRSLRYSMLIADECQNVTPKGILALLTRMESTSKIAIIGNSDQKDTPSSYPDGLLDATLRLKGLDEVGIVIMGVEDIQRSSLLKKIHKRYSE